MLTPEDTECLRSVLGGDQICKIEPVENLQVVLECLKFSDQPAIFCDVGNAWQAVLKKLSERGQVRSKVVVCARHPTTELWAEVFNLGGYDILGLPFDHESVKRTVKLMSLPMTKAAR